MKGINRAVPEGEDNQIQALEFPDISFYNEVQMDVHSNGEAVLQHGKTFYLLDLKKCGRTVL